MTRIGIIGCGRMGIERARAALAADARVAWVCDADAARANQLAGECSAAAIADSSKIDWKSIDAIFICTPPVARGPLELEAVRSGVALFVEKPIGMSADQCAQVLRALDENPVPAAVGYMNRYRPSVLWARDYLRDATPLGMSGNWVCGMYKVPWWSDPAQSGGQINEQCTHLVDLSRFLIGEIREVHAMIERPASGADIQAAILLRFQRGILGTIFYSCQARDKQIGMQIFTQCGRIALQNWDFSLHTEGLPEPINPPLPQASSAAAAKAIFQQETAAFLSAVRKEKGDPIRSDLRDAVRTQQVVDAIVASAISGKTETVGDGGGS
jgi:myo-inositol 2-dehydrogenase / D-chiro-inositol 1-dehydrogenase